MDTKKYILWDFDGTLGYRPGLWRKVLADVLLEHDPDCATTSEELAPFLRTGFPWHQPDISHSHITTAELWWTEIEKILTSAYIGVGLPVAQAHHMAHLAHQKYIHSDGWLLYEDVIPALEFLTHEGWKHAILSNHVPELPAIVDNLGLTPYIVKVITSALIGYEKPHPEAFFTALKQLDHPETIWMIGDNIQADVLGAEAVGIRGILVRKEDARARYCCPDLAAITAIIISHI